MNQKQQLQEQLNGTKEHESFEISPRLDAMLMTLTEPQRRIFMGKLWSLERVYAGIELYKRVNLLVRATFSPVKQ
jgi:hypothetical protein